MSTQSAAPTHAKAPSAGATMSSDARRRKAARLASLRSGLALLGWQALVLVGVYVAWVLVVNADIMDPTVAKGPDEVWAYLKSAGASGELWTNTAATMKAVLIGFALASVVGVVAGISLGLMPRVDRVLGPLLDAVNAMPRIALAPVFIVWLGIGITAKVALAFSVVVFVVLSGARAGVRSADSEVLRMSVVLGITKRQLFTKVLLPVAVPSIFAGLRLGLVYSLLAVVGSEIIASQEGLGQRISFYSGTFELASVYGILLVLAVIAAVLNIAMAAAERWLLRWQAPTDS